MDFPTTVLCIVGIAIGVGIICYVLLRTPKTAAKLPISEIVVEDEEATTDGSADAEGGDK